MSKLQVLFVDDEPGILSGLRRSLRRYGDEWEMHFASGGSEALDVVRSRSIDVVVSDMRMPVMDGAQLLAEVRQHSPGTLRLILSGHSEQERILRSVDVAHAYLSKPCEHEELHATITRLRRHSSDIATARIKSVVAGIGTLPSAPTTYVELMRELYSAEPDLKEVSRILRNDIAMTAKILHVVNSAFFGLAGRVSDPEQAVCYLGCYTILALAISSHAFCALTDQQFVPDIQELQAHSLECSARARQLAAEISGDPVILLEATVGGMLHDTGRIIQMIGCADAFDEYRKRAKERGPECRELEEEVFGFDHAKAGSYLMSLWGLPETIVSQVAYHHIPAAAVLGNYAALAAIHVAEARLGHGVVDTQFLADSGYTRYLEAQTSGANHGEGKHV